MRFTRVAALAAFVLAATAIVAPAQAAPIPECEGGTTSNCVVWVQQNGAPPVDSYELVASRNAPGFSEYLVEIQSAGGGSDLDPTDIWSVRLNMAGVEAEEITARGRNVEVTRSLVGGDNVVTVTMRPVEMATRNPCDASGCGGPSAVADEVRAGVWSFTANDLAYLSDPADRAAMRNYVFATSADWASTPPQLDPVTNSITLDIANAHFKTPGVPFIGSAQVRLPKAMLTRIYGVDDPDSLTASAFRVSSPSGTPPTTSVAVDAFAVDVYMTGIEFSKRTFRVKGTTWPRAPRELDAERKSAVRGVIRTDGALPRGSKVRGYQAVCRSAGGDVVRKSTKPKRKLPIRVSGLAPGTKYTCTVRAKSKAGLGTKAKVTMPRRP